MRTTIYLTIIIQLIFGVLINSDIQAQEKIVGSWNLNQCINYALENSIQVKQKRLEVSSIEVDLLKSKSEWLPSINASVSENFSNSKNATTSNWEVADNTTFSLSSSIPIYQGGSISNSVKKSKLNVEQANLNVEVTQKNITLSIVQAYLNILYAKESLDYYKEVVVSSEKQVNRTTELYNAGSAVRKDLAQMEAQLANDKYSFTLAQNNIISTTTALKQLLEISVTDTFNIVFPDIQFNDSLIVFPSKLEALNAALQVMPEIKSGAINTSIAETNLKIAKAGYYPSISLNAGYSTDFSSKITNNINSQLTNNQLQKVGVTLNIPIFNRNTTKTAIQQSKIGIEQAKLNNSETEKNLLQQIESVYQETIAAISQFKSAKSQMKSASESFNLSEQQFNLGMINIVELLKVKTTLLNARMELIQSKYSAILNLKVLDFYMGKSISL